MSQHIIKCGNTIMRDNSSYDPSDLYITNRFSNAKLDGYLAIRLEGIGDANKYNITYRIGNYMIWVNYGDDVSVTLESFDIENSDYSNKVVDLHVGIYHDIDAIMNDGLTDENVSIIHDKLRTFTLRIIDKLNNLSSEWHSTVKSSASNCFFN